MAKKRWPKINNSWTSAEKSRQVKAAEAVNEN